MLPVHQLPSELLSSILLSASRQDAPQKLPRRSPLHRLAAVSYRWWKTVTLSPIFWTDITSRLESDVGLYLRKSQDAPLNIKCFAGYCNTRTFVETVAGAAHRWRSITLHYNSEDLLDNLPSAMPQLTDMQISTPGGSQSSVPRNILNLQGLVKLRHLCLRNVGFHWENLELEGLLSLRLCRLQHTVPNFTWITAVLQRSPQLQHLALRELEILPESVHTTPTEIQLLQLKSLQLSEVREGISRYLLSTIYSPNLKAFQFVEYIDPRILGYDEILCQAVLKRCIPSVLQNLEKITIRSRSSGTEIEVTSSPAVSNVDDFNSWTPWATSPDSGGLYILFFNHDYTLSENPVITMLSESGLEKATRGEVKLLIQSGLGGRFNPLLLDKLPTLTTLAATNSTDVRGILRHLGECRMQHGTWSYPCPRLETLDIRWANEDVGQGDVDTFFVTRYADAF
ncbi:hypothetical protein FRB90_010598 [Tulasnella sp. 427]|nr:hypothetical protein FRB90_010598 [Tulasnella sp. 427]